MFLLNYIIWNADPALFTLPLFDREVRYYGLLFVAGFLISQQIMFYIYRKEGKPEKDVETLTVFMLIATIIGARLGHVLFYEPDKYLSNPIDILKIWEGGLASHGAAFGILLALWLYTRYDIKFKYFWLIKNNIGLPQGISIKRVTRPGQNWYQVVDRIVIVVALTGCLIRFGNFMNSEIYGKPTHSAYGVVFTRNIAESFAAESSPVADMEFKKGNGPLSKEGYVPIKIRLSLKNHPDLRSESTVRPYLEGRFAKTLSGYEYIKEHIYQRGKLDYTLTKNPDGAYGATIQTYGIARHPTQLYESLSSFMIFIFLFMLWARYKEKTPPGLLLGLFLIILFGLRFMHELFKENQVSFEDSMQFNMGQILSIPLILAGIIILIRALGTGKTGQE